MKNIILSTVAAAALALSTGAALANDASPDNGFAVYQQSQAKAPVARTANYQAGTDNGFAVYQQDAGLKGSATFLSASAGNDDHVFSNNGRDAVEFRKTQEQGR
jgi:hypothetical protein